MFLPYQPNNRAQTGAALILALLVVVMVTALATSLAGDFLVTLRRVENQLLSQQAHAYLRGSEGLARSALQADFEQSPELDHRSEGWLDNRQEFPLDQGVISGTVCDLQGRFNLNSLIGAAVSADGQREYSANQAQFIRLLQTLDEELEQPIAQSQAEQITNAIADWIDSDEQVTANGGAENGYYSGLDLPYRVANKPLLSSSELRWIKGLDAALLAALAPHVTVLPAGTLININSATRNVIQSINEADNLQPISPQEAESILQQRDGQRSDNTAVILPGAGTEGFAEVADFIALHPAESLDIDTLVVSSDYFLLDSAIVFMERQFRLFSVLHRDPNNGRIRTIARAPSGLGECEVPPPQQ
ncbi:MAG: general secretion pathway protein K [Paraglaciecola psychrophila]